MWIFQKKILNYLKFNASDAALPTTNIHVSISKNFDISIPKNVDTDFQIIIKQKFKQLNS